MKQLEIEGVHDLVLAKLDSQLPPEHGASQLCSFVFLPPDLTSLLQIPPCSFLTLSAPSHPCPHVCPPELPTLRCSIQQILIIHCHFPRYAVYSVYIYIWYSLNYGPKVGFFTHLVSI